MKLLRNKKLLVGENKIRDNVEERVRCLCDFIINNKHLLEESDLIKIELSLKGLSVKGNVRVYK